MGSPKPSTVPEAVAPGVKLNRRIKRSVQIQLQCNARAAGSRPQHAVNIAHTAVRIDNHSRSGTRLNRQIARDLERKLSACQRSQPVVIVLW